MPQSYDDAAGEARDAGFIHPQDVREREIQAEMKRYLYLDDPNSAGANKLVDRATKAAMDQVVKDAEGHFVGKRRHMQVWTDRWGNIMSQRKDDLGARTKLVDKDDR